MTDKLIITARGNGCNGKPKSMCIKEIDCCIDLTYAEVLEEIRTQKRDFKFVSTKGDDITREFTLKMMRNTIDENDKDVAMLTRTIRGGGILGYIKKLAPSG